MEIKITASDARPSTCVGGGTDVDVDVQIDGDSLPAGEVTLVPAEYDGRPVALDGGADYWVSGRLLRELRDRCGNDLREALNDLEEAARNVIPGYWEQGRYKVDPDCLSAEEFR